MNLIIDDHLLAVTLPEEPEELGQLRGDDQTYVGNIAYMRLFRNIVEPGTGKLSRTLARLGASQRSATLALLMELPTFVTVLPTNSLTQQLALVYTVSQDEGIRQPTIFVAEMLALSLHVGGMICIGDEANLPDGVRRVIEHLGLEVRLVDVSLL